MLHVLRRSGTTYDDLLLSSAPFPEPIALQVCMPLNRASEGEASISQAIASFALVNRLSMLAQAMVDFLVEAWNEEGLYE